MKLKDLYLAMRHGKDVTYKDSLVFYPCRIRRGKILCISFTNIKTKYYKNVDLRTHRGMIEVCSVDKFLKYGKLADGYEMGMEHGIRRRILDNVKSETLN